MAELKAQLQHDPDPLSRIEAADCPGQEGQSGSGECPCSERLSADPFWGVRAEVAEQLASVKLDQAVEGTPEGPER
jgi:aminopeptidase N